MPIEDWNRTVEDATTARHRALGRNPLDSLREVPLSIGERSVRLPVAAPELEALGRIEITLRLYLRSLRRAIYLLAGCVLAAAALTRCV